MQVNLSEKQLTTIAVTINACCLIALTDTLPEHSRKKRAIDKVDASIRELAALNTEKLDETAVSLGRDAWNAAIAVIAKATDPNQKED